MLTTFTWNPDPGPSANHDIRVLSVNFGDGYVQDTGNGINTDLPPWSITLSGRSLTEFNAIKAFLVALPPGGRFNWTPPAGVVGLYKCVSWKELPYATSATHGISATFQQVVA